MACENLSCIGEGGCVEPLSNGSAGDVMQIGAGGTPVWADANLHPAATATGNPALTVDAATQVITFDLDAAGSFTPEGSGLISTTIDNAIKELAESRHPAATAAGNPALTIDEAAQVATLDLDAAGSYTSNFGLAAGSVQDALDELAQCRVCNIIATNTCIAGGMGTTFMVRGVATDSNGTLTVNGAPEHYGIGGQVRFFTLRQPWPTANGPFGAASEATFAIANPSTCRSMSVIINVAISMNIYGLDTGEDADVGLNLYDTAANAVPLQGTSSQILTLGGAFPLGGVYQTAWYANIHAAIVIPPSTTVNLRTALDWLYTSGNFAGAEFIPDININFLGATNFF